MPTTPQRSRRLAVAMPAEAQSTPFGKHGGGHGSRTVDLQLLAINDFHGNLEPPAGSSGRVTEFQADGTTKTVDAGGVEYLSSSLRTAREGQDRSLTVAAASPLLSGLFHDEPTVEAMNEIGLDVTGVGNHEFDEGKDELLRLQKGGCHPTEAVTTRAGPSRARTTRSSPRTSSTRRPAGRCSSPTPSRTSRA